ncbi:MAG: dNTP triphosphohydrolase [Candidatus Peregrinibacteria bacterium]
MQSLSQRILQANTLLAPYAVPHQGVAGRVIVEADDETRFPFQRDRDRIIHTQAFRRLQGKTQVFVVGEYDHVRTRLTHTMEVAQISRDIARTLRLNEDLAEAIALAHDLGHPPFGHAGEQALNVWMTKHGGHFEHNEQSLRIVTVLEEHSPLAEGLNLNREILDGLQKHTTPFDIPPGKLPPMHSLEAQLVNLADEIAYTGHDCDDGMKAKLFSLEQIREVPLASLALKNAEERKTSLRGALIHLLVSDLYSASDEAIQTGNIATFADVQCNSTSLICFSSAMKKSIGELRTFLWKHLYLHPQVQTKNDEGQQIILALCDQFEKSPLAKITALQTKTGSTLPEAVKDYVAGMTDAFAEKKSM